MTHGAPLSCRVAGVMALAWLAAGTFAAVTPTPTPRPKLSGGFGRPRNTPAAPSEAGQSPADAVRSAQENRGQTEKSSVTIDNRSLVTNPDKGKVSTSKVAPAPTHAPAPAAGASGGAAAAADGTLTGGTEAEWRATAAKARKRVEDAKQKIGELSAAVKKLENDFYAWDDGQYRDRVIKPAWDRTRSDLETAKGELVEAEKDLADLPEKARRAGAMPGWIRE